MTTTFPALYKRTSTGATQVWSIAVDGATISATYGQLGGAMQSTSDTITKGKNIGRSNETTPEQQAVLEAQSQWERKQKRGYNADLTAAQAGEVDATVIAGGIDPMLAQSYAKHAAKIAYPAAVQPKLDGHRCIAEVNDDGSVSLWSRTRKPITGVPHIAKAVEALGLSEGTVLDGELYHHDYRDKFEELTSFIRQANPKPGHEVVQYHVYDIDRVGRLTFVQRNALLADALDEAPDSLVLVDTRQAEDAEQVTEAFAAFTAEGYEGAIVRNLGGFYKNGRSYDLQKVKEFDDAEWTIVDVVEGRGKMAGLGIFVCAGPGDETFAAKMAGPLDQLADFWINRESYIGRSLTVQYQGLTAAGLPRFPIGLRLRADV